MIRYLCKRRVVDKAITGYRVGPIVDSNQRPDNSYDILLGAERYRYRKAEKVLGEWSVIEDLALKTVEETKESKRQSSIDRLDTIDWSNVTTVAKIKAIVRDLVGSR